MRAWQAYHDPNPKDEGEGITTAGKRNDAARNGWPRTA